MIAIKPTPASEVGGEWSPAPGGRFSARGVVLREMIAVAYGVQSFQVVGGPRWITTDRWSVEAKAEGFSGRFTREQLQKPLQRLLTDRFQLRSHTEAKEMRIYVLVTAPSGPKLKPATQPSRTMRFGRGFLEGTSANLDLMSRVLANLLQLPVLNQTGIMGEYDISLEWSPEPGEDASDPSPADDQPDRKFGSIFTEIQEKLGLRLESKRAPAEVVSVDYVDHPVSN